MFVSKDAMQASKVQVRSASVPRTRMKSPKQLRKISGEAVAMSKSRKLQECIVPGTYRNVSISHARDPDFELERASKLMNGRRRCGMICFPWCSVLKRFNCPSGLHKPVGSGGSCTSSAQYYKAIAEPAMKLRICECKMKLKFWRNSICTYLLLIFRKQDHMSCQDVESESRHQTRDWLLVSD